MTNPFKPLSPNNIPEPDVLCIVQRTSGQWMIASRYNAPLSVSGELSNNCHWYSFVELGRPTKARGSIDWARSFNDRTVDQWAYLHEALPSGGLLTVAAQLLGAAKWALDILTDQFALDDCDGIVDLRAAIAKAEGKA